MGPIIIFDKSFLESLNQNEAVWLEQFFVTNLTPLFYIETLGDLSKKGKPNRPPEKLVKDLASKTPQQNISPNVYAGDLIISELLGYEVGMSQKPIISNIKTGETVDGEHVSSFEETTEEKALNRWETGQFTDLEKIFSTKWRSSLPDIIKDRNIDIIRNILPDDLDLRTYQEIYDFVLDFIQEEDEHILYIVQKLLHIPNEVIEKAKTTWNNQKPKSLSEIAPYTSFVVSIEMFFHIGLIKNIISREKISNRMDILYLHYLPFTNIFVSTDNLHKDIVPLFLEEDQLFVSGPELKQALNELNKYFYGLPEEEKAKGVINFAKLPQDSNNLVCKIWDNYLPSWRKQKQSLNLSKEEEKQLIKQIKKLANEKLKRTGDTFKDSNHIIKKVKIKRQKGDWDMLPKDLKD
jgi:hypothetical protein